MRSYSRWSLPVVSGLMLILGLHVSPAWAAGDPALSLLVHSPNTMVTTAREYVAIQGEAEAGSSVVVFRDQDRDRLPDAGPIARTEIDPAGAAFEVLVSLIEGENQLLVQAQVVGLASSLLSIPVVTRTISPTPESSFVDGTLEVLLRTGASRNAVAPRNDDQTTGRVIASGPAFQRLASGGDRRLERWQFVHVKPGQEAAALRRLRANSDVEYAQRSPLYKPAYIPNDPRRVNQYSLSRMSAYGAWDTARGISSTRIAVLDTQYQVEHPDLSGKLRNYSGQINSVQVYTFGCPHSAAGADHGTSVAGVAAAGTDNGTGIAGVGFNAVVLAVQLGFLSGDSCLIDGSWTTALQEAVDVGGAQVVNMSFGSTGYSALAADVTRYASGKGAVLVAAAGNSNTSAPSYPAAYPTVLAVAATDSGDQKAGFSNYGPWIDVAAPGVGVDTTCYASTYCSVNGTSFSSPNTADGSALLVGRWSEPGLRLAHRLKDAADRLPLPTEFQGRGRVNLQRAVTERAVRLAGSDRYETAADIVEEGRPTGNETTVVLVSGEERSGWVDTLPSAGLVGNNTTATLMTTRFPWSGASTLHPAAQAQLDRLFAAGDNEIDRTRTVIIPGGTASSISSEVEAALARRFTVRRIAANDRYSTAAVLADEVVAGRAVDTAVIVRGDNFGDALAMAGVAAKYRYPMLYVTSTTVPQATCDWLSTHGGVTKLVLAGGTSAISSSVESALKTGCGGSRSAARYSGVDRYATSVAIANAFFPSPGGFAVANGTSWADSLVGSVISNSYNTPLLLSPQDALASSVDSYISSRVTASSDAWLLGGTSVLSDAVEGRMEALV